MQQHPVEIFYLLFIIMLSVCVFSILEKAWRLNYKWIIPIVFFPPLIMIFSIKYFSYVRSYWFFIVLTFFISILVSTLTGHNFTDKLLYDLGALCSWQLNIGRFIYYNLLIQYF